MIHQADPSVSGEHAGWIIKLFLNGKIRLPEDTAKLNTRLTEFSKIKHKFPVELRDLNRFPDYPTLAETLDQHSGIMGKREEERVKTEEGQEVIFEGALQPDGPQYRVIKVTTSEASAKLARNTDWCIKDPKYSRDYLADGPLYFIDKDNKRYLLTWSNCIVDITLVPLWKHFQTVMQEHRAKQTCIVCNTNTESAGNFLCSEHSDWKSSLEDARCDQHDFKEMAGMLHEIPDALQTQVGNLIQFRSSTCMTRSRNFRHVDLQIMDVYDRPAKLLLDELDLLYKIFPKCVEEVEFFLRLCEHTRNYKAILEKGASFLGKATPQQLVEIFKTYAFKMLPGSKGEDGGPLPVDYLKDQLGQRKLSRWKEAESYIFQSPSAAYDYYTLLEASLRPNEVAEFQELIQKHPISIPTINSISTEPFGRVHFPDSEAFKHKIDIEYHQRVNELESWKKGQLEKLEADVGRAGESLRKELKRSNQIGRKQQKIIEKWKQTYIPQLEAGEIQLIDIIQPLYAALQKGYHRAGRMTQQILVPYIDYYGKGYLIYKGKGISLENYLGTLRKAMRGSRRRGRRRGHISDQVRKRETTALLDEVEKAYKKKIKAQR
jgi:hypothetical protein